MESQKALLVFLGRESDVKHGKGNKVNPGKKSLLRTAANKPFGADSDFL